MAISQCGLANGKLSVQNEAIDSQHEMIYEIIEKFEDAIDHASKLKLHLLFEQLYCYTCYHFTDEEHFLLEIGYPDIDGHIWEHKLFLKEVSQFESNFKDYDKRTLINFLKFFKKWLTNHILIEDKKYSVYINSLTHTPSSNL